MTINQVEPIYVTFSVPEARLPEIKRSLLVMASRQDDTSHPETGELTFIDNVVDPTTGTIRLKGTFRNSGRKLWPGEFVRVTVRLRTQPNALVVPNQAVQTGQDGTYVFVVKTDQTVESRPVVTGTRVDADLVVETGLRAGETVVVEGQLRLAPDCGVRERLPAVPVTAECHPRRLRPQLRRGPVRRRFLHRVRDERARMPLLPRLRQGSEGPLRPDAAQRTRLPRDDGPTEQWPSRRGRSRDGGG